MIQILHNPRYAGAYVYGRTRRRYAKADSKCNDPRKVAREEWPVLIRDAHPGYISWEEFERNELTLRQNMAAWSPAGRGRMPREGTALLQGRVDLWASVARRMRIHYLKLAAASYTPYYVCTEEVVRHAGACCQSIRGRDIDAAVSALLLRDRGARRTRGRPRRPR